MDKLIVALATGFYSGKIPFAPGTWGSAFALIPWYFCRGLSLANYLIVLAVLFVVGGLTPAVSSSMKSWVCSSP